MSVGFPFPQLFSSEDDYNGPHDIISAATTRLAVVIRFTDVGHVPRSSLVTLR